MDDAARRQRAEARKVRAVLNKTHLSPHEQDLSPLAGAEAVSLVRHLTHESYRLAGIAEPTYTRDQTPYRFVRRQPT
jgi:hypothetical protein